MRIVYLLRSIAYPNERYVGSTSDLAERLQRHNDGGSPHTAKFRPWRVVAFVTFEDDTRALAFERYLKSGSGRAFANKHFW
ncbi:MAG: GIY-YIG nuclease family protein [Fimbriimonas ginsengisoli]|uniref:GIY-YIG nuclease family protein n=1 Tax=Fimbriimonas ginsengisoli TaxID=1005039 RepID=A0A931LW39_FIMGI|nr:GIY-YIG nuclease family protein [Fimbriimonas ginsengisoli]